MKKVLLFFILFFSAGFVFAEGNSLKLECSENVGEYDYFCSLFDTEIGKVIRSTGCVSLHGSVSKCLSLERHFPSENFDGVETYKTQSCVKDGGLLSCYQSNFDAGRGVTRIRCARGSSGFACVSTPLSEANTQYDTKFLDTRWGCAENVTSLACSVYGWLHSNVY